MMAWLKKYRQRIWLATAALLLTLNCALLPTTSRHDKRLVPGNTPIPIQATTLSGKSITLETYKGKVLLIDFWATWCGPCRREIPNVVAAYNQYKDKGFDVLGISLDKAGDQGKLEKFIKENGMGWEEVYDGGGWNSAVATNYGVRSIPFSLLIGRDGKISAVGLRGSELEPAIRRALEQ